MPVLWHQIRPLPAKNFRTVRNPQPCGPGSAAVPAGCGAHFWRRPVTTLRTAQPMPTAKMAVPNTKTCGGMPILVAP
jgi:hypothetical protein